MSMWTLAYGPFPGQDLGSNTIHLRGSQIVEETTRMQVETFTHLITQMPTQNWQIASTWFLSPVEHSST